MIKRYTYGRLARLSDTPRHPVAIVFGRRWSNMRLLSSHQAHFSFCCISKQLSMSLKNVTPTIDLPNFWNVLFHICSICFILNLNVNVWNVFPNTSPKSPSAKVTSKKTFQHTITPFQGNSKDFWKRRLSSVRPLAIPLSTNIYLLRRLPQCRIRALGVRRCHA